MIDWMHRLGWTEERLHQMRRLGHVYIEQGHYDRAIDLYEALAALSQSASDQQTLGALHLQAHQPAQALPVLESALAQDPSHLPTLLHKGKALVMMGEAERGLTLLRALETAPDPSVSRLAGALVLAYS